jgi:hypothetical protein
VGIVYLFNALEIKSSHSRQVSSFEFKKEYFGGKTFDLPTFSDIVDKCVKKVLLVSNKMAENSNRLFKFMILRFETNRLLKGG